MTTPKNPVPMLVITGGPCAGKSTLLVALEALYGDMLELVPEAATILRKEGYPDPPEDPAARTAWFEDFQQIVAAKILDLEAGALVRALDLGKLLLICDRGLADGFAYHPGGPEFVTASPVFTNNNMHHPKQVLNRYYGVIHMESLAVHHPDQYQTQNNKARYETVEQAVAIDQAIAYAWHSHHNWTLVCNQHRNEREVNNTILSAVNKIVRKLKSRDTPYWNL